MPQKKVNNSVDLVSINKFISSTGFCSRREADDLIEQGRVTINEEPAHKGDRVSPKDTVAIDGENLKVKKTQQTLYIAFNKPVGITSTTDTKDRTNIISYINHPKRIFPIGRLDKDSDGLIFLTNDGDIVNKILRAGNNHEKEYIVTVDKAITPEFIHKISNGVPILKTKTRECFVKQEGPRKFRIILTQGLNRQIRRMCKHFDYRVVTLTRVRIMNVSLGKLPVGKWRLLTAQEIDELNKLVSSSSKTQEASKLNKRSSTKTHRPKKDTKEEPPAKKKVKNKTYKDWRKRK
ncbi:MAG: 23S rRNA pseudouridine(2604) synthase RluF [Chitinophagales bacterium]|nr:23S rRNA pseudouridine(2604) synthase RluF [Chitinophagaceae bacterium]MCB9065613.1 23S rRNA pseudouridine(2604) synthase RluF [Chitinophagales bacterium]